MTYKAREVLADCQVSLGMLQEETDFQKWRVIWVSSVALIRAVGHVLDKVDGEDNDIKVISQSFYKNWKGDCQEHLIFREFIEQERNNILKEYTINIHPLPDVPVVFQLSLQPVGGGKSITENIICNLDENLYRPIMDGHWAEEDARDTLQEAIKWWERQLDAIDKEVSIRKRTKP